MYNYFIILSITLLFLVKLNIDKVNKILLYNTLILLYVHNKLFNYFINSFIACPEVISDTYEKKKYV